MMSKRNMGPALIFALIATVAVAPNCEAQKTSLDGYVDAMAQESWRAALQIWEWAEPGYQEHQSAQLLAGMLQSRGFRIKMGVAEMLSPWPRRSIKGTRRI